MGWATTAEAAGVLLVVVVVVPLLWLALRRRWLDRRGGLFECARRVDIGGPRERWSLGFARYNGEDLEWFRAISLSLHPRVRLVRRATVALETRDPGQAEALTLYAGQRVVRLQATPETGEPGIHELAMDAGAATGLLAWLEAAPPSVGRFRQ